LQLVLVGSYVGFGFGFGFIVVLFDVLCFRAQLIYKKK